MQKVRRKRKRKERKKEKKHTNSIAWIWARASRPAVSFACLKLHHAAKETKYKIGSISEYYVTIKHTTHRLKKKHLSRGFINIGKKVTLMVQMFWPWYRDLPKHLFFNGQLSWCSIGAASSPTKKRQVESLWLCKELIDRKKSRSLSWLFDCHLSRARNIKKWLLVIWLAPKKGAIFNVIYFFRHILYIPHNYVIPQTTIE